MRVRVAPEDISYNDLKQEYGPNWELQTQYLWNTEH